MGCIIGVSTSMKPAPSRRRRIRQEIEVSLPCPGLSIGEAVVLLGQWPEGLGQHREFFDGHTQLTGAGAKNRAFDAQKITQVELLEHLP
jgi:hypothetical protein